MLSTSHGPGLFELVFEFLNSGSFHLNYVLHLFFISIFSFVPRPWLRQSLVLSQCSSWLKSPIFQVHVCVFPM